MSRQDDAMTEQDCADALFGMGEAEWRDMYQDRDCENNNTEISLCKNCWCMTHTINKKCGKCKAYKEEECSRKNNL